MKKIIFYIAILFSVSVSAQIKISDLPATTSINDADILILVQSGNTRKITKANLLQFNLLISDTTLMLESYITRSDTGLMLTPYINRVDTAIMLVPYINRSDTASMLSTYIEKKDTASMLGSYINRTDTASMLDPYARKASPTFTGNADADSVTIAEKLIIPRNGIIYDDVPITATPEQINYLSNVFGDIADLLSFKAASNNSSLTGITDMEGLRVGGTGNKVIASIVDDGGGLAFRYENGDTATVIPSVQDMAWLDEEIEGLIAVSEANFDNYVKGIQALGSTIKAIPLGMYAYGSEDVALTDGSVFWQAIYLEKDTLLSGIKFSLQTAGDYTATDSNQVALFTYDAGTVTLVRKSKSNADLWKATANTTVSAPFTSQYQAVKGLYYVAGIYNESGNSQVPIIYCGGLSNINLMKFDLANDAKLSGTEGIYVTFPATRSMTDINSGTYTRGLFPY